MTQRVVSFSGGLTSWACAKVVAKKCGTEKLTLLFADTKYEDADLYRFLHEAAENVGGKLVIVADGRNVWQVFYDERFLGNSRVDPCSKILKRQKLDQWFDENTTAETVSYIGYRWDERHRFLGDPKHPEKLGFRDRMLAIGRIVDAPLIDMPHLGKSEIQAWCEREGLNPPATYDDDLGGNCGGRCIKAGQKHWAKLLKVRRESYLDVERKEQEFRDFIGQDVSILKDRRGGTSKPMSLKVFRERMEGGEQCENDGIGGCRCIDA